MMDIAVIDTQRAQRNALMTMLGGSALIFLSLLLINNLNDALPEREARDPSQFEVKREVKKPPKAEPREVKKPKPKTPPPPMPASLLNSDLSGLDLGLLAFSMDEMGGVDKSLLGDTRDVVLTGEMVDVAPRPTYRTPLEYPPRAKSRELEGYVVLSMLIDRDGHVETVKVLESEPVGIFESAAMNNVRGWRFEPARYKGRAVRSWANQTIRFNLN